MNSTGVALLIRPVPPISRPSDPYTKRYTLFNAWERSTAGSIVWAFAIMVRESWTGSLDEVPALFRLFANHSRYVGEVSDDEIMHRATSHRHHLGWAEAYSDCDDLDWIEEDIAALRRVCGDHLDRREPFSLEIDCVDPECVRIELDTAWHGPAQFVRS